MEVVVSLSTTSGSSAALASAVAKSTRHAKNLDADRETVWRDAAQSAGLDGDIRTALQQRSVVLGALPWDAPRIRRILAQARIISREVALGRITFFLDVPSSAIVRP